MRTMRPTRTATPADNQALLHLTTACAVEDRVGLCLDRAPDFFSLDRLEGDRWRVQVVDDRDGAVAGYIVLVERTAYVQGHPSRVMFVSDLKVHPGHHRIPVAHALIRSAQAAQHGVGGANFPILSTVPGENFGRRDPNVHLNCRRDLPRLSHFATVRSHAISLLWRRQLPRESDVGVAPGDDRDVEEMAALWRRIAPGRQFAPVFDAESLARWIAAAPSFAPSSYWLARRRNGRLAGFLGLWDQTSFKQIRLTRYSARLAAVRAAFNCVAPFVGATRLPPRRAPLPHLVAVHVCVPAQEPGVLRTLLIHAHNALRGRGHSFLTIALDVGDPLSAALKGLLAQPIDSQAYVWIPAACHGPTRLDDRPFHFEPALL